MSGSHSAKFEKNALIGAIGKANFHHAADYVPDAKVGLTEAQMKRKKKQKSAGDEIEQSYAYPYAFKCGTCAHVCMEGKKFLAKIRRRRGEDGGHGHRVGGTCFGCKSPFEWRPNNDAAVRPGTPLWEVVYGGDFLGAQELVALGPLEAPKSEADVDQERIARRREEKRALEKLLRCAGEERGKERQRVSELLAGLGAAAAEPDDVAAHAAAAAGGGGESSADDSDEERRVARREEAQFVAAQNAAVEAAADRQRAERLAGGRDAKRARAGAGGIVAAAAPEIAVVPKIAVALPVHVAHVPVVVAAVPAPAAPPTTRRNALADLSDSDSD